MAPQFKLIYWPGIPGRGEWVRLAFEYAKHPYSQELEPAKFMKYMKPGSTAAGEPHALAPPMLEIDGKHLISQTPNILLYLGDILGLSGTEPMHKYFVNEITLTILDLNDEVHDTHHPISVSAYYEDQKAESLRKAENVRTQRIPKFLGYLNAIIKQNGTGYLVGDRVTYADLCAFQICHGLQYAFPKCFGRVAADPSYADLMELTKRIGEAPQIAEYMKSERRSPYSMGVFRYYPELDDQ